jgi:hypothetical protein
MALPRAAVFFVVVDRHGTKNRISSAVVGCDSVFSTAETKKEEPLATKSTSASFTYLIYVSCIINDEILFPMHHTIVGVYYIIRHPVLLKFVF